MIIIKNHLVLVKDEPLIPEDIEGAEILLDNPAMGDTITFDGERWVVGKPLLKLAIEDPQDGDVLTYDGTAGAWKNVAPTPAEVETTPAEET